jgi:hypothetical protein
MFNAGGAQVAYSASTEFFERVGIRTSVNPYDYADIPDPSLNFQYFQILFEASAFEAQADMFEELHWRSRSSAFDARRWDPVSNQVKQASNCECKR